MSRSKNKGSRTYYWDAGFSENDKEKDGKAFQCHQRYDKARKPEVRRPSQMRKPVTVPKRAIVPGTYPSH